MCYSKKTEWTIIPKSAPKVYRNCPKCGKRTHYINSNKFRVNANGKNIDVWLIYNCSKCKSKYNMTIHERINPKDIEAVEYNSYIKNDTLLSQKIGFDLEFHKRNNSQLIYDLVDYEVLVQVKEEGNPSELFQEIRINCPYPFDLRLDKLLAEHLKIPRSKICKSLREELPLKKKIRDGMTFLLPNKI